MKPRWPRGKYNGRRITGLKISITWRTDFWDWIPVAKWNYGQPFFYWLGLNLRAEATYHHLDA